jgi:Xaa-Pro aminopeptidase
MPSPGATGSSPAVTQVAPIDYRARIARVVKELDGGVLVVPSQPEAVRNSSVGHHYRQESFFHWLTGFVEPEAALVLSSTKPEGERATLFLRERNPERELWDGRRVGVERAKERMPMIDRARPIEAFWDELPDLIGDADKVFFPLGLHEEYDRRFIKALNAHKGRYGKQQLAARLPVHDAYELAGRVRLRKESAEIERMRAAAAATRKTYETVFRSVRPGMNEREVHALLVGGFLGHGGEMEAYGSIVAGGVNACILHYHENDQPLRDGELLLIDAGAQVEYFACDVTRTFPVGKTFTPEQRALYDVVLAAQKAAIAAAVVGSSLGRIHDTAIEHLVDGLLHLKIMQGSREEIIAKQAFRRYYPHGTSHWIGMDVHDVGVYRRRGEHLPLEAGMYFSVEPGLYVDPADTAAPEAFRGIGIRIEDDVLVTAAGPDVVTAGIAKEPRELENRF